MNFDDLKSMILNTKRLRKSKNASELKGVNPTSLLFKDYFTEKVLNYTNKYYYEDIQIREEADDPAYLGERKLWLHQFEDREIDPKYNDINAPLQIHTFGCSWTYGWDIPQEQTFTHLLGDENTSVHNYGAGGTGLDFAVKTLSEVYIPESTRQIFIITMPHFFRRTWFDDNGVVLRSWQVKEQTDINEYNNYFNFLHNYELLNRFVGRDKIIWGTWENDIPRDKFDVVFECIDHTSDGLHPGPKAHKQYAERLKKIMKEKLEVYKTYESTR